MVNYLNPSQGILTAISSGRHPLIGQALLTPGRNNAKVTFLTPADGLEKGDLSTLLEYLAVQSGSRGALQLLAAVEESSAALELLRHNCFTIYGRETLWRFSAPLSQPSGKSEPLWKPAGPAGVNSARSLFQLLVPPLVQAAEPFNENVQRMIYRQDDEVLGYVEIHSGPRGVWVSPLFHPGARHLSSLLADLFSQIPPTRLRPVYLAQRTYQGFLTNALTDLGGLPSESQCLLVRHLSVAVRSSVPLRRSALEMLKTDPEMPVVHPYRRLPTPLNQRKTYDTAPNYR